MGQAFSRPSSADTVLVVEDDPCVRELAVMMIEDEGFPVLEADCAQAALALLKERAAEIAVVFTDVRMPGPVDGLLLAEIIHLSWPSVPVLITSGDHRPAATDLPGSAQFLPKPWRPAEVLSALGGLTGGAAERTPAPALSA